MTRRYPRVPTRAQQEWLDDKRMEWPASYFQIETHSRSPIHIDNAPTEDDKRAERTFENRYDAHD